MRLLFAAAVALAFTSAAGSAFAQTHSYDARAYAGGAGLNVPIDQGVKVDFAGAARDVVVGNPNVADVTILGAGSAMVLGKSYGVTNVSAFDAGGRVVFSRQVVVGPSDTGRVAVYRGVQQSNFACASSCEAIAPASGGASAPTSSPVTP